jgi:hypothetical protein
LSETKKEPNYKISISNGYVTVESPTKKECIELLQEALKVPIKKPIDEGIR